MYIGEYGHALALEVMQFIILLEASLLIITI